MKHPSQSLIAALCLFGTATALHAGPDLKSTVELKSVTPAEAPYHYQASRGLITLEGPSGMFMNPTSATLPKGKFALNYCLFFPNQDTDVVGQGIMFSFGVMDWLEVGLIGNLTDVNADAIPDQTAINRAAKKAANAAAKAAAKAAAGGGGAGAGGGGGGAPAAAGGSALTGDKAGYDDEFAVGGPLLRIRLLRDQQWWPELSVGGYLRWGTNAQDAGTIFVAASKRIPIDPEGFFKSITVQSGFRETWFDQDQGVNRVRDSARGYGGVELQLPYRIYLIGEYTQKNNDFDRRQPWAAGFQCRLPGVELTCAALQDGGQHERFGIYSGIGISFGF